MLKRPATLVIFKYLFLPHVFQCSNIIALYLYPVLHRQWYLSLRLKEKYDYD